jgi:Uma2 family endonuclease
MTSISVPNPVSRDDLPEPAWDVAMLFPAQGSWTEDEYLSLPGNHIVEFSDGYIEVPEMPTMSHQLIVAYLYRVLHEFVAARSMGRVLFSALPVRLRPGKFREPDVLYMSAAHHDRAQEQYWDRADLVMEVVSANHPERDWVIKREEYAQAGIPEYWIIDPQSKQILVLTLEGKSYSMHGQFSSGQFASSKLLDGFQVNVASVFAAAND